MITDPNTDPLAMATNLLPPYIEAAKRGGTELYRSLEYLPYVQLFEVAMAAVSTLAALDKVIKQLEESLKSQKEGPK